VRYIQDVIFSSQITSPEVEYFQTKSLRVSSEGAVPVEVDGELIGNCPVQFKIRERSLRVFAPGTVERVRVLVQVGNGARRPNQASERSRSSMPTNARGAERLLGRFRRVPRRSVGQEVKTRFVFKPERCHAQEM